MNRKLALIGTGVTVGTFLLITSAYAGVTDSSGYESYKTAIKTTVAAKSMTQAVALNVLDNGSSVLSVNGTVKKNNETDATSADVSVTGGGKEQTVNVYKSNNQTVLKTADSDTYKVITGKGEGGNGQKQKEEADFAQGDTFNKEAENLIDALVGNLKQYVSEAPATNGGKDIHISLSGNQIPTVVNAFGSFLVKKASHDSMNANTDNAVNSTFGTDINGLKQALPKLSQDVAITNVDIQATVDSNNFIVSQKANLTIAGKDDSGTAHTVVVSVDLGLSGLNTTTPDSIDLTGKQVQTVDSKQFGRSMKNH
jgi:hypothetical protein